MSTPRSWVLFITLVLTALALAVQPGFPDGSHVANAGTKLPLEMSEIPEDPPAAGDPDEPGAISPPMDETFAGLDQGSLSQRSLYFAPSSQNWFMRMLFDFIWNRSVGRR
jgi:hypothetical protein